MLKKYLKENLGFLYSYYVIYTSHLYESKRFVKYHFSTKTENSSISYIIRLYHSIEKGLTMPNFRFGFGKTTMQVLIKEIERHYKTFGTSDQLEHAVKVVSEYDFCHKHANFTLDSELETKIDKLLKKFPEIKATSVQVDKSSDEYFKDVNNDFLAFSESRKSVRNFSEKPVEIDRILEAIKIAQNAPSACNRQPGRVKIISDQNMKVKALELQNGNRGFDKTID
jgi:hypothetical protein